MRKRAAAGKAHEAAVRAEKRARLIQNEVGAFSCAARLTPRRGFLHQRK
ncbi:hypothetical protein HMPREF0239_01775 [Clostridium sp. ATCC BAA-442]|uniref:Uncharacterized protein n=1 Tax=Flavonifractor plautii ATCC 29863 TaxID=411475 RepID=G9YPG2_FLAPL|nr:hypothetical protein HMPREF0372_01400 [Flavonifractor plautii ATCC 29863]ERI77336.1 hypothetical protein HMPREF0239_01775 [Clostridium sp. ATCC BAA-442]